MNSDRGEPRAKHADAAAPTDDAHGAVQEEKETMSSTSHGESASHGAAKQTADPVRGLAVAENGLRVIVEDPELRRGRREQVRFRIVDNAGNTVRDFDVKHDKRMHFIVARRDLTGFQHLHPKQAADGSWTVDMKLDKAGSYRLFADFSVAEKAHTLASELRVDGSTDLVPLPAPSPTSVSDGGYDVRLDAGDARPGQEADLRFTITKGGQQVHAEPYLGADGHLVALREGDMAFLHVHPTGGEHGGTEKADGHDDAVAFMATFPTKGAYRLFLQFKHEDRVQTVAFTQEVK
ncbi:MAG: hypothetical protein H0T13_06610 [Actinobacteria bacterium]|nr:hypothetical protein [Actinomycetota bacterium]